MLCNESVLNQLTFPMTQSVGCITPPPGGLTQIHVVGLVGLWCDCEEFITKTP